MRTLLFRTPVVTIDSAVAVTVFVKNLEGAMPLTITVENEDTHAKVTTSDRYGSPDSKLEWEWADGGTGGNAKTVTIVEDEDDPQGCDLAVVSNDFTVTVGRAVMAWQVIALLQTELESAGMLVRLAPGSDGICPIVPPRLDDMDAPLEYELEGGAATSTTGAAGVSVATKLDGPFVNDSAAVTALSTVAEGTPKSHTFTAPTRVVKLTYVKGSGAAYVSASARRGDQ